MPRPPQGGRGESRQPPRAAFPGRRTVRAALRCGRRARSEAWAIRPQTAAEMQPAHPGDSSYELAARALTEREFVVRSNLDKPLTPQTLASADVLVIAHPSDPRWERTTGIGSPRLSDE